MLLQPLNLILMLRRFAALEHDSRALSEWFAFVSSALDEESLALGELARAFLASGLPLDDRTPQEEDEPRITAALEQPLAVYTRLKLVSLAEVERYTTSLRIRVTTTMMSLTKRGRAIGRLPAWRRHFFFQRFLAWHLVQSAWKPFAKAVAVAGTVTGALKLILMWKSEQAALAGALSGAATMVGLLWPRRH